MTYLRKNVWAHGGDWSDPAILWYARGVKALKARPLTDPTAWRFYGAIHGFNEGLWTAQGYFHSGEQKPAPDVIKDYWNQCQHGAWYFLPWHRGYVLALENLVRAAIVALGGPKDWALPYWNYFGRKPGDEEYRLPPAFGSPDWPDGTGDNPLHVVQRYGPKGDGNVYIPLDKISQEALKAPLFTGVASGGSPGFGGVETGFTHSGQVHGLLEMQPHDMVHVLVGGRNSAKTPGLMTVAATAGLDPIFWLHHANIDRLWEVWRLNPPTHIDPVKETWLAGPPSVGERAFMAPRPDGSPWIYTPKEMSDLSALGYTYDDLSSPFGTSLLAQAVPEAHARTAAMAGNQDVELLGASGLDISLTGAEARASVAIDPQVQRKVTTRLLAAAASPQAAGERVFLNLENVRGLNDATAIDVYLNVPEGEDPARHPELRAGSVGLFGVSAASESDGEHAGHGVTFVLDVTDVVDGLRQAGKLGGDRLDVRLVPLNPVDAGDRTTVGRISVFRQGA